MAVLLTLVDTGVPILHAINERVARSTRSAVGRCRAHAPGTRHHGDGDLRLRGRAIGLISLIEKGYGWLTYARSSCC